MGALLYTGCSPQKEPLNSNTPKVVETKQSKDQTRDAFYWNQKLKRGVNLGAALEAPKEGEWGVRLEEKYFDLIAEAGFKSVRIPV